MIQTKRYNQGMQYHLHAPVELLLPSQARQEGCAGTHPLPAQRGGHPVAEHESQRCPRQPRAGLGRGSRPARGLSRHSRAHRAWAVGSLLTMRSQSPAFTPLFRRRDRLRRQLKAGPSADLHQQSLWARAAIGSAPYPFLLALVQHYLKGKGATYSTANNSSSSTMAFLGCLPTKN